MTGDMRITLDIAGGLAPPLMNRRYVIDAVTLTEQQRDALAALIDDVVARPEGPPNRSLRDARSYEVRIATESGERTIVAYDGSMQPETRRLIEMIKTLAKKN
jgi:hypothetical protein